MVLTKVSAPAFENNLVSITNSKTIGLTFFNSNSSEQKISNLSDYFYFGIPRTNQIPLFKQFNTSKPINSSNLLTLDGFMISNNNVSIHYQLKPTNMTIGYLIALKFGSNPYLNKTIKSFDMFQIFCPLNDLQTENNESFYTLFANMSKTINFKGFIGVGIKQLSTNELIYYCINKSKTYPIDNNQNPVYFTGNISVRVYLSGCYYINKTTGLYSSYGMEVLSTTNTTYTQCISNHLTEFASGWIVIPNEINFNYIWANASFTHNKAIYITIILIITIYSILLIWAQIMDKYDTTKLEIKSFSSNKPDDSYFYEIKLGFKLPFNLKMKLLGSNSESRIFKINRGNSNLRYILSTESSLGKITNIDIMEEKKLNNRKIKFISKLKCSIHNLLTREENHLHFNKTAKMFCIKEEEEHDSSKLSLSNIVSNMSLSLKEQHGLFSIFNKRLNDPYLRSDRLTCLFTLLFLAILMEIIYYDTEIITEEESIDDLSESVFKFEITPQTVCVLILFSLLFII
jgi:hypothetical protein